MKSVLLVGLGRFGRYTAKKLNELGHEVMAVEKDEERLNKIIHEVTDARIGDATSKEFLETLGVSNFDLCIVAIGDSFLESLEVTSLLSELGSKKTVARATSARMEKFLLRNGADAVVFPEREFANWTAIRYSSDKIENYIEVSDGYAIYEIKIPPQWDRKRIDEVDVRKKFGISILGIRNGKMNMNPSHDTVLRKEDTMLVLGTSEDLHKLIREKPSWL